MNTHLKKLLWTGVAMAMAGAAHAAPVTTWSVGVNTVFDEDSIITSIPASSPVRFDSPTELSWGTGSGGGDDSGLVISDSPITTFVDTDGALVPNVSITHRNNPIVSGSGSLRYVDILSTLTLAPSTPPGPAGDPATITFGVSFFETPNAADPCADGTPNNEGLNINGCADIFVISRDAVNFLFVFDDPDYDPDLTPDENLANGAIQNRPYFISFLETTSGLNPLPNAACDAVAGANPNLDVPKPCIGFRTPEEETTTFQFGALITSVPVSFVPEPGTLALLGLGLGALGLGLRRRRSPTEA